MDLLFEEAKQYITYVCHQYQVDDTHGLGHAVQCMNHIKNTIDTDVIYHLDVQTQHELLMVGLLHDLDDHKYFPKGSHNAQTFLELHLKNDTVNRIMRWISYVSTSQNGNQIPLEATHNPWVLWPRYCDRIEAVGQIGIERVIKYNRIKNIDDFIDSTPRATSYQEVISYVTPDRFERYLYRNGASDSIIDHIYDKLLHICVETDSPYINHRLSTGKQLLVEICINYGKYRKLIS
jgi:hypothetical protein